MITGIQIRMARAALKMGVRDLAALVHMSPATITRIEGGGAANRSTLEILRLALETRGVKFFTHEEGRIGAYITKSAIKEADIPAVEAAFDEAKKLAAWNKALTRKVASANHLEGNDDGF